MPTEIPSSHAAICQEFQDEIRRLVAAGSERRGDQGAFVDALLDFEERRASRFGLTVTASHTYDDWTVVALRIPGQSEPCVSLEFHPQTGQFRRVGSPCRADSPCQFPQSWRTRWLRFWTGAKSLEQADIEAGKKIASQKEHPWVRVLVKFGDLGDQGPLYTAAAGLTLFGLVSWNRRHARTGVAMLLAAAAADGGKRLAKSLVKRTRPYVLLDEGEYESDTGGGQGKPERSFPSGHTACTLAVARALSREQSAAAPWSAAFTGAVALARLAKGAHWPLDVAAGLVIGYVAELASSLVLRAVGVVPDPKPSSAWWHR